ncbi:MAG: cobalamin biosynthesis protein CobD [Gemmatimonadetes bacterium]|nr:cobalamin biosynthesis protein CobD [Gemmatimonadota bacterium]MYG84063.1 cobalamin biosynthesis protein CobD [Gemmatimonadota bacterium]MYJ89479.1 cobalamin biosynthesis protein CobD [Gemmatimonadota bacterium]
MDLTVLAPHPLLLLCAVALDGILGDPVYRWHPVRLMGFTLTGIERMLRRTGLDGYAGGCMLFLALSAFWVGVIAALALWLNGLHPVLNGVYQVFVIYSMVALRDLCRHGMAIDRAGDLDGARRAVSMLVGRDTSAMDAAACRRAGMESLSENAVDGFIAPVFWYALLGLPGIVLYKVISTMDSMVGYRTPRYLRFGWCGARLDDLFNLVPARLTWLLMAAVALLLPGYSGRKALSVGWRQHGLIPGPNSGWSEAAAAGAVQRRLIGPIWQDGKLVTEIWIGDEGDPEGGQAGDLRHMRVLVVVTCVIATALSILAMVVPA